MKKIYLITSAVLTAIILAGVLPEGFSVAAEQRHEGDHKAQTHHKIPKDAFRRTDAYLSDALTRAKIQRFCLRLQVIGQTTAQHDGRATAPAGPDVKPTLPEICTQMQPPIVSIVDCSTDPTGRNCTCETPGECDCLAEICPTGGSLPDGGGWATCENGELGRLAEENCRGLFE